MVPTTDFSWFSQLDVSQKELIQLSYFLYEREERSAPKNFIKVTDVSQTGSVETAPGVLYDYSFVVFPIAKAYEGFLKQYLYDLQLINENTFAGKRFRIGRALNPDIRENQQDEFWLYDDVELLCGKQTAHVLWQTWLQCRNRVVHFFPKEAHRITLKQAHERIEMVMETIDVAFVCKMEQEELS